MNAKGTYPTLGAVRLTGKNPFTDNRKRTLAYLKLLPADMMLYSFRRTFGVDTKGADAPGGWDAPDGLLRGHSLGHFISALSLAYDAMHEDWINEKLTYIVGEVRSLQKLSRSVPSEFKTACTPDDADPSKWSCDPSVWGEGYVGAYPPDQFALLEMFTPYNKIWAPYYTLHKILAGMLECYERVGIGDALDVARGIGDWVYGRLSALTPEHRQNMWGMYIAGEYGGMNESLARLYIITHEDRYLEAAKMFDNDKVFSGLAAGEDTVQNLHANQHIPQLVGAMAEYEAAGDEFYHRAAGSFFDIVTKHHMYATGGVGRGESFRDPDMLAANIDSDKNCETCAAYNMIKLARALYAYAPDEAKYMHYVERALVNHILASQNPHTRRHMHNGVTYMLPIGPGAKKDYSGDFDTFTCCHGTGMENHVKYQENAYFVTEEDGRPVVYINLYLSSEYADPALGIDIKLRSAFPFPEIKITVGGDAEYDVKLRIPEWARGGALDAEGKHFARREYIKIEHTAGTTETFDPGFEYALRLEYTPDTLDGSRVAALMYGPFVMAAKCDDTDFLTLDVSRGLDKTFTVSLNREAGAFALIGQGMLFVPMYLAHGMRYHTYFKIEDGEPAEK